MPHATMAPDVAPLAVQNAGAPVDEDAELRKLFEAQPGADGGSFLDDLATRPLELGEKADNAVDYEDISDDDLPDEEDLSDGNGNGGQQESGSTIQDFAGDGYGDDDDLDDLFGGGSSPVHEQSQQDDMPLDSIETSSGATGGVNGNKSTSSGVDGTASQPAFRPVVYGAVQEEDDEEDDPELREQMALFAQAGRSHDDRLPPPPQSSKEYFDRIWPNFEPGKPPRDYATQQGQSGYCGRPGKKLPASFRWSSNQSRTADGGRAARHRLHY
jgi:hypothetical protein